MRRHSRGRVRLWLLGVVALGGAGLLASSAPLSSRASPGAAQLVRDVCALVEPVDAPSSVAAAAVPPEFKWKHRKLGAGSAPAIATTAAGDLHVVFPSKFHESTGKHELKHAWRVGNAWHSETIDSSVAPAYIGDYVALAVGSDGAPHVAYTTWNGATLSGVLHYATRDAAGWQIETVEATGSGGSMSIAIDDADVPHILHLVGNPSQDVRYLTKERGGWTGETIASTPFSNHGSALQLHDSHVYATFLGFSGILALALGDGEGWTVDSIADTSGSCGLAFDEAGVLHLAYVQSDGAHSLTHAWLTEGGWMSETLVDTTTLFGEPAPPKFSFLPDAPALTADASGRIRLAFGLEIYKGNKYGRALTVAFLDGGAWTPVVAGKSLTGFQNSIATDAAGIVHLATVRSWFFSDPPKQSVHAYSLRGSKLSLSVVPKGSGTIGVAPLGIEATGKSSVSVYPGDAVTLTATAGEGFEFAGWSGALSGTDPIVEVTMDHASKVIAHFAPTER